MKEKIREYAILLTINLWGAACLTAVYGALSNGELDFFPLFLLALIGTHATTFSSVFNDYADVELDKLSEDLKARPLVKGSIPRKNALYISILSIIISYIITILAMFTGVFILNINALFVLSIAIIFGAIYNLYGKKFTGSDIFPAIASGLFCLFGALIVSEIISMLTMIVVLVVSLQVFFLNGFTCGFKDADHDYLYNIKNILYRLGLKVKNKKVEVSLLCTVVTLLVLIIYAVILFIPIVLLKDFPYYIWQPVLMILILIWVFYLTIKMLNMKIFDRNEIRKIISIQEFLKYFLAPLLLFRFVGIHFGLFLIVFPFLWFVILNQIMYGNTLKPKRM